MSAWAEIAPARIHERLTTRRYGRSLVVVESTGSTNDDAMTAARGGAVDGHVVLADRQSAGRGAHGRRWESPAGSDLYLSILDRPDVAQHKLPPLTLAVGLGVADAVDALLAGSGAPRSEVKWPNDLWIGGRKCAGVLVEASAAGERVTDVVIGIGLNVNRAQWPPELDGRATSLRMAHPSARAFDRAEVLATLLARVEHWVERFVVEGAGAVVGPLDDRLAFKGREVRCDADAGILIGIAPSGAARIATAQGVREVIAGTLLPVEPVAPGASSLT